MKTNTFSISDIEKALKYIKAQHAMVIKVTFDDMGKMLMTMIKPADGSTVTIVVYCADSAKMPDITRTETLF